jgi:hypothetical protein
LRARHPRIDIVHAPTYPICLEQIEIYFSIIQREMLKPNNYSSLEELRGHPVPPASRSPGASLAKISNDVCVTRCSSQKR